PAYPRRTSACGLAAMRAVVLVTRVPRFGASRPACQRAEPSAQSSWSGGGPDPREERELAPSPLAVDVGEADVAEPTQLGLDVGQLVRRIVLLAALADGAEERGVQRRRRRLHVLEVAEHATGLQPLEDLAVQL